MRRRAHVGIKLTTYLNIVVTLPSTMFNEATTFPR